MPREVAPLGRCTKCNNTAFKLVFGRLCVSCYNRLIEALKGANARGQEPKKLRAIRAGDVSWAKCGGATYVAVGSHVRMLRRNRADPRPQWSLFDTI